MWEILTAELKIWLNFSIWSFLKLFNFLKFQFLWNRVKDLNRFERFPLCPCFVVDAFEAFLLTILAFLLPTSFLWCSSTGLVDIPKPWLDSSIRAYFLLRASVRFLNKIWAAVMWVASFARTMAFLNAAGVAKVTACIAMIIKTENCMLMIGCVGVQKKLNSERIFDVYIKSIMLPYRWSTNWLLCCLATFLTQRIVR